MAKTTQYNMGKRNKQGSGIPTSLSKNNKTFYKIKMEMVLIYI